METTLHSFKPMLPILAHVLLGAPFVVAGLRHLRILDALATRVRRRGIPYPRLTIAVGTAFQIVAGTLLVFGLLVAPVALGLAGFTVVAGLLLLDFWNLEGAARGPVINTWLSNVAVIGGLLVAAAVEIC